MLTKSDKSKLRSTIFRHLDGIATSASAYALHKKDVLNYILKHQEVTLKTLSDTFNANEGYLNVALRVICSQGWLEQHLDNNTNAITYSVNKNSSVAFKLIHLYEDAIHLLKYSDRFAHEKTISTDAFIVLERIFKRFETNYDIEVSNEDSIEYQILKHIEGVIAGPIIVLLGVNGLFHKYFMEASFTAEEYHKNPESFKKILDFLAHLGWFIKKKNFTTRRTHFWKSFSFKNSITRRYRKTCTSRNECLGKRRCTYNIF